MALAGGVIGWLLRSLTCRAEVAHAKVSTVDHEELDRLRGRLANLEPAVAERDRLRMELADVRGSSAGALGFATTTNTSIIPDEFNAAAASAVLGKKIRMNDLTVVEGIGPKISELCNAIGITTWAQLAATDVDTLQSMLNDAGSRFQMHKPGSWPGQAGLLAAGQWADFRQLTADIASGTSVAVSPELDSAT